jgi:hypothetical protein
MMVLQVIDFFFRFSNLKYTYVLITYIMIRIWTHTTHGFLRRIIFTVKLTKHSEPPYYYSRDLTVSTGTC